MGHNKKLIISESERSDILNMYDIAVQKKDYIFDFVLSENHKYLIIMDQLFVEGNNGVSLGSIWDNTFVFNEIIKESLSKVKTLTEDVQKNISNFLTEVKWEKNLIYEWINQKTIITESTWWEDIKSGVATAASGIIDMSKKIFSQGVLPGLRWIRRGLYTGVGIVIDVVVSILAVKTNVIVWVIVCLLDIYEIAYNDYDPQDPQRKQLPYFFLIADLFGVVLTGAFAFSFKKSIPAAAKEGIKSPIILKALKTLAEKIPSLKTQLNSVAKLLGTKLGPTATGFISKLVGALDRVLGSLYSFITKLFSTKGLAAAGVGVGVIGVGKGIETGMKYADPNQKFGQAVVKTDQYLQNKFGTNNNNTVANISQDTQDQIFQMDNR